MSERKRAVAAPVIVVIVIARGSVSVFPNVVAHRSRTRREGSSSNAHCDGTFTVSLSVSHLTD